MIVRFNFGRKHYKKWQITDGNVKSYYDPAEVFLKMYNCQLYNRPKTANKIYKQEIYKTVCSWVKCDRVEIVSSINCDYGYPLYYNPRINPFWFDHLGNNIDKQKYELLITNNKQIYLPA